MALLDQLTKTPAQKAADTVRNAAQQQIRILENLQKDGIRALWHDQLATPQEILDELGVDSGQAFACHGILTSAILQIRQVLGGTPSILLPKYDFTQNEDGTVTVLNKPYPIPPGLEGLFPQPPVVDNTLPNPDDQPHLDNTLPGDLPPEQNPVAAPEAQASKETTTKKKK